MVTSRCKSTRKKGNWWKNDQFFNVGRRPYMQNVECNRNALFKNGCVYARQYFLQTSALLKSLNQPVLHKPSWTDMWCKRTTCWVAAWGNLNTQPVEVRGWPDLQSTSRSNCSLGISDNIWEGLIFHQKDWECLKSAARSYFNVCNHAGKIFTASQSQANNITPGWVTPSDHRN